jgi:heat shock protein HslJ
MSVHKIYYLLLIFIIVSCNNSKEEIFWVSGFKNNQNNNSALLILRSDTLKNINFISLNKNIEGFNFEEGYLKKIKVKEQEDKYILLKELEKKKDYRTNLVGKWKLKIENDTILNTQKPTLNIMLNKMNFNGTNYCNNYRGNIDLVSFNSIKLHKINNTKKMCDLMNSEQNYLNKLTSTETYLIKGNHLYFYNKGVKTLSFTKQ